MSGHSKWSKIKHQKGATDAAKGKVFTKIGNTITLAVKENDGNTDPNTNFRLRLAIENAHKFNLPKANIERAIERAKGLNKIDNIEEIIYEGFGPSGVGLIIVTATSNKLRTVAEIKNILDRGGGSLATQGAVLYLFKYTGLITLTDKNISDDKLIDLILNLGGDDYEKIDDTINIYTPPIKLNTMKKGIIEAKLSISSCELIYRPTIKINIAKPNIYHQIVSLIENLEELDDVSKVYTNLDSN